MQNVFGGSVRYKVEMDRMPPVEQYAFDQGDHRSCTVITGTN